VGLKHLIAVEKWTLLLAAVAVAGGMLLLGRHAAFSLAIGATLTALNAMSMRRIAGKLGPVLQQKPALTVVLFNLKMALLIGFIYAAIRWLHVDAVPFIVGISLLPAAIFIVFVQYSLTPPKSDEETHG
jgi:hypothetical protein